MDESLVISPQFLANSQPASGLSGYLPDSVKPPVNKNLKHSPSNYPLNSISLVDNRNENNNLSFSNKDLQIFLYSDNKK